MNLEEKILLALGPPIRTWPCPLCAVGKGSVLIVAADGTVWCSRRQHWTRAILDAVDALIQARNHLDSLERLPAELNDAAVGLTFALVHDMTPGLTGAQRLELFHQLPQEAQNAAWRNLRAQLRQRDRDEGRA
jgi:hypothetical protein